MKRAKGSTAATLDILDKVLGSMDDPTKLGTYLAEELKEKTGASCVLFLQYTGDSNKKPYRILGINPLQKRKWAESINAERFYDVVRPFSAAQVFQAGETSEASVILQHEGFDLSLAIPLNFGALHAGAMLMLGLPDEKHLSSVFDTPTMLAAAAALVLNNAQLQEGEKQDYIYRLIVETANEGIWLIDKDSKTSFVNDRMADMLGFTKEEMTGVSLFEFMDAEGKNIAENAVERRKLGKKEVHDFRFLRKDGNYIWASLKTSPVFDKNNNYAGALAMVTDITDNRRSEEALIETKSRLQALIHEIPDMVIFKDLNCTHLVVNKAVEEFTGLTYDELVGKTNEEILPPDIAKTCTQADEDAMRSSEPIRYEENTMSKSGKKVVLDSIKAPIHDAQGKVMGLVMISRDITDRKLAEEEIRMLNARLEQRVRERTAQLDAANKELEAFSYSVSHDLRAPLRSIDGFTQAIAEDYQDRLDDTGRDYINRVRQGVKKMTDLIEAMLGLSRLTRGEIKHEAVDLSMIARQISDDLKAKEPQRHVEFIIQDGVIANGDARMLKIVLDNLISNAWKFTGRHPSARIEFGEKVSDGNTEYFVRDDGAGFDEAYYDKLFSAFARLHTEAEFPGIGIGLATVQRIINRHGGKVRAEGEVEKGAAFYFSLK